MNEQLKIKQHLQDEEYLFPYHYIPTFYPNFSQTVDWTWGMHYISAIDFVINKVAAVGATSVVDVGCGDGRLVKELANRLDDINVHGIDYSERAITLAQALNPTLRYTVHDILTETLEETYDAITLVEVFEHIPIEDTKKFVTQLAALLSDGGRIFLTVPHKNKPLQDKHFQHFDLDLLTQYYGELFEIEEVVWFEKRTLATKIINKLLSNSFVTLQHKGLKQLLYFLYMRFGFIADAQTCGRIFLQLKKK